MQGRAERVPRAPDHVGTALFSPGGDLIPFDEPACQWCRFGLGESQVRLFHAIAYHTVLAPHLRRVAAA